MRFSKHISLALLTAFSILLVHNMVPHHHHMDVVAYASALDCPVDHHNHPADGHEHEKEENHCHAFNDIDFVKYNTSGIPRPVKLVFGHLCSVSGIDAEPETFRVHRPLLCRKIHIQDPETKGLHHMRAPPVL
jgi:hypothetical protein